MKLNYREAMERINVYYTNFMKTQRRFFAQPLYYVEVYEGRTFDCSQFFDSYSSVLDFGRRESAQLDDPKIYVTSYQISRSKNGRFVMHPLHTIDKTRLFL